MDTSKEYIKMCEKAEEIQEIYFEFRYPDNWKCEDLITACKKHRKRFLFARGVKDPCEGTIGNLCIRKNNAIWLPRQDQLQEIWFEEIKCPTIKSQVFRAVIDLSAWYTNNMGGIKYFNSMEQLWLAFVMKEKYNKTWNGKQWNT